jgi:DNA helicase-2/ATP-dependent DNA helicase PcrA
MTPPAAAMTSPDAILDALDPEQREVASRLEGPMCVLAGAGTGKTRAITHRIAYGVHSGAFPAQGVLAVTFTARAAGEMRTRLRSLGVVGAQARTFHAAALRQLHFFWPQAIGGGAPEVVAQKASAVAEAAGRLRMSFDRTGIRDLAAEIEWSKVSMLTADSYAAAATRLRREAPGVDPTGMARLIAAYEEVKAERHAIDFEDVLLLTVGILEEREDIATAVRRQYRHFVVDEFQDVNALQHRLLSAWLGGRHELCVVGDPAQTIYSFTGATPQHLIDFPREHRGSHVVRLVRNYRSTPQIVGLANLVLTGPGGSRRSHSVELQAQSVDGDRPELTAYDDDPAEAEGIAVRIRRLVDAGTPPSEIAVLFRTNAQSEHFEAALAAREVPYLVRGGERFFSRKEVRDAVLLLRGQARSDDGSTPLPDLVRDVLLGAGWTRQPPNAGGAARERWESLAALAQLAEDLEATTPEARLPDFVRELDERAAASHAPTVEGVTLASLHAAKGLEWGTVFLAGLSDGYLPITMAETAEAIEEERRLLYVGVTRARQRLELSYARARTPGGRATRRPSRFLDQMSSVLGDEARSEARSRRAVAKGGKGGKPARLARCRSCGGPLSGAQEAALGRCGNCPATYDEALYERLKAWRLAVAQEARVPAYVVFTDATLTAIAETEPSSAGQLAQIRGLGAVKVARYGDAVLALLGGADVQEATQIASATKESGT